MEWLSGSEGDSEALGCGFIPDPRLSKDNHTFRSVFCFLSGYPARNNPTARTEVGLSAVSSESIFST